MRSRTHLLVAAVAVPTLLLAGCGDDGDDDSGDDTNTETVTGDEFAEQDAEAIIDAAVEATKSVDSLRLSGTMTKDGESQSIDLAVSSEGHCEGTMGVAGGTAEIISDGESAYLKGDSAFWMGSADTPEQGQQVYSVVGDKWAKMPPEEFEDFCSVEGLLDELGDADLSEAEVGDVTTVEGQEVVTVTKPGDDGGTDTAWVSVDDPHYLVQSQNEGGSEPGTMTMSDFGEPVEAEAPSEDEVVDLSQS